MLTDYEDTFILLGSRDIQRGQDAVVSIIQIVGNYASSRIELLPLDVTSSSSVSTAAETVLAKFGPTSLHALVNNAGIGWGNSDSDTISTNIYGLRRVTLAFMPMLCSSGRVVNISSASGPMYISKRKASGVDCSLFMDATNTWEALDSEIREFLSRDPSTRDAGEAYGFSKACVNAYTLQLSTQFPTLQINSCTPGFIDTDLTRGMGATNTPESGTRSALFCLFSDIAASGRYYGSDAVRSPLDKYRGPGEPAYEE